MPNQNLLRNSTGGIIDLPLSTKRGRHIPNEQKAPEHPVRMAEAERIWTSRYQSLKTRSLESSYNCVGMVFASRRTWVEPEHVGTILQQDGYRQFNNPAELMAGDVVIYRDGDGEVTHVGLVACVRPNVEQASWEITVLSQWGRDGEYFHRIDDVSPLLGVPCEYWTERK